MSAASSMLLAEVHLVDNYACLVCSIYTHRIATVCPAVNSHQETSVSIALRLAKHVSHLEEHAHSFLWLNLHEHSSLTESITYSANDMEETVCVD